MAQHMGGRKTDSRGEKPKRFHHTSDKARHKLEVKRWQLEEEEGKRLQCQYESIKTEDVVTFDDLPLSVKTKTGLRLNKYTTPTEIQRATVGLALQGKDVLGAAKTGSGKTLAFLIPVLECLYRGRWSKVDGLGVLVISPTRELAYQTFEVLCKVGKKHDFSAALIIGGKDVRSEKERITRTNIVVCTPGRFLQHLDQTVSLDCSNLQILVLDEADRILDLGFEKTMNAILEFLPVKRQTLLFSATQTKSVRDLARLSLKDASYVAVHQHHEYSTPSQLEQSYIVCNLEQKLDLLYSFIRNHTKKKILVFLASCKQVKYFFEVFCALHPGITVMALYGTLHQLRRVSIYNEFCKRDSAVLLATDIAARGLDFPAINWVLQLDCPEDASTYIHRVGRTARYERGGESLLILLPSEEEEMVRQLADRKIPVQKINVNPNRKMSVQAKLQSLCAGSIDLKQSAQRCFINYVKSVYLMKNKKVFDVAQLPLDKFSFSLGLAIPPRVRFLNRAAKIKDQQAAMRAQTNVSSTERKEAETHLDGPDRVEAGGGLDDENDLDSLVAKLRSTAAARRAKTSRNIKPLSRKDEEDVKEDVEIKMMQEKHKLVKGTDWAANTATTDKSRRTSEKKQPVKLKSSERTDSEPERDATSGSGDSDQSDGDPLGLANEEPDEKDGDSDDGDFLVVKKEDVFGVRRGKSEQKEPLGETIEGARKAAKPKKGLSKAAEAKKLLRMKMTVNCKKSFDEDGGVVKQWPPRQHTAVPCDAEMSEGGIDIDKTKEWMRAEDQFDKQAYRERIRAKHKAERFKIKEERRKFSRRRKNAEDEDKDEDNEEEEVSLDVGDDFVPFDPDTLPDPDDCKDNNDDDDDSKANRGWVDEGDGTKPSAIKRKGKASKDGSTRGKKKRRKPVTAEAGGRGIDTDLTLRDNEELALHILANSQF